MACNLATYKWDILGLWATEQIVIFKLSLDGRKPKGDGPKNPVNKGRNYTNLNQVNARISEASTVPNPQRNTTSRGTLLGLAAFLPSTVLHRCLYY